MSETKGRGRRFLPDTSSATFLGERDVVSRQIRDVLAHMFRVRDGFLEETVAE